MDPESEFGNIFNQDLKTLKELYYEKCIILLGEPGSGKTTTLNNFYDSLILSESSQEKYIWVDLSEYSSDALVIKKIFETKEYNDWLNDNTILFLFIDALDEGMLKIDNVINLIISNLKESNKINMLRLRITCRSAHLLNYIVDEIETLFGFNQEEKFNFLYELAPLRLTDVEEAAKYELNEKSNDFIKQIMDSGIVPLAVKPISLQALLNFYKKNNKLPNSKSEAYEYSLLLLCNEVNETRRRSKIKPHLSPSQRYAVIKRIAAISIFSNCNMIYTGIDMGNLPDGSLSISQINGDTETASGNEFIVDEKEIIDTFDTGLFVSVMPDMIKWSHKSYAEFLAAKYLIDKNIDYHQICNLLTNPLDPAKKILPQLYETAAWLAVFSKEIFKFIVEFDPETLLMCDTGCFDHDQMHLLIEKLLEYYGRSKSNFEYPPSKFKSLNYSGASEQIKNYLIDKSKIPITRKYAIDIAKSCNLQLLQDVCLNIALDESDHIGVKINAASAIHILGNKITKGKFSIISKNPSFKNIDDEFKGWALFSLWPEHISADLLFDALTLPKNPYYYGSYFLFMSQKLIQELSHEHFTAALKWVYKMSLLEVKELSHVFINAINKILLKIIEISDQQNILKEYARVVYLRIKKYRCIVTNDTEHSKKDFERILGEKREKRLELLRYLFIQIPETDWDYDIYEILKCIFMVHPINAYLVS